MLSSNQKKALERLLGTDRVFWDPEVRLCYAYDATRMEALPDGVVRPRNTQEVAALLEWAHRERVPLVPRGAGTGFVGGSVPFQGGLVLSLQDLNRILEIAEEDCYARVEAGVITGDLQRAVEARGLFYPPDPTSSRYSTIGGNIATAAGGARGIKYGTTRDYVLGLEVVLPGGEILRTGALTARSVTGYDLTHLMVGSEGTLGVITQAVLRLIPKPERVITTWVAFGNVVDAARAVIRILRAGLAPRILEFMDRTSLRLVSRLLPAHLSGEMDALLMIEVDGPLGEVEKAQASLEGLLRELDPLEMATAREEAERERLWEARRALSPAMYRSHPRKLNEDVVVPRSRLPDLIQGLQEISRTYQVEIITFGHAGDGNLHVNIMTDDRDTEAWARAQKAVEAVFRLTLDLGGSLSGEHGIGVTKAPYLAWEVGQTGVQVMQRIKQALDPHGILNPGKVIPMEGGSWK